MITGTWLNWPLASAGPINWVSTVPSTSGSYPAMLVLSRIVETGRLRRQAAVLLAQPTLAASAAPAASASASEACVRS